MMRVEPKREDGRREEEGEERELFPVFLSSFVYINITFVFGHFLHDNWASS